MPSSGSSDCSSSQGSSSSGSGNNPPSKYRIVKDGWGSRTNFQGSYGLKMDPNGLEEGNQILSAMQKYEYGVDNGSGSGSGSGNKK